MFRLPLFVRVAPFLPAIANLGGGAGDPDRIVDRRRLPAGLSRLAIYRSATDSIGRGEVIGSAWR